MCLARRSFATLALVCAPAWTAAAGVSDGDEPLPRVLLIVADDLGIDRIGHYGDELARTPNIDRLAATGAKFLNCWSNLYCSPTRGTLLTGRYAFRTGMGHNVSAGYFLDPSIPNLADAWASTDLLGKWHLGHDPLHPLLLRFDHHRGSIMNLVVPFGGNYFRWLKAVDGTFVCSMDYATSDTTNECIASTARLRIASYNAPHSPFHVPPANLHSYGQPITTPRRVRAMVESLDTEIGRLLATVDDETIVIFTADNGTTEFAAEPGENPAHMKGSPYEGGVRVPLIVRGPGVVPGERRGLVNTSDLYATLGGQGSPDSLSLWPVLKDPDHAPARAWIYAESFFPNGSDSLYLAYTQAIRNERYKLIRRMGAPDELYDLAVDPTECHDLWPPTPGTDEAVSYARLLDALPVRPF